MIAVLQKIVGAAHVLNGEAAAPFCKDWRGRYQGDALAVVFPADTQQVSDLVKLCVTHGIAIVPQGGNTSLCGASVPLAGHDRQLVINLSRMNRIMEMDANNYTMTVAAGCKLASIYAAAEQHDRLFPLGLTAIAPHCEIGGNISTNAGGIGVLRYGSARNLVLGLEVVLPDGRIWNGLRSLRKDNTGYDLKQLFIGAEGTLGIITAAVLKLYPRPAHSATACVAIANPIGAVRMLAHIRERCGDTLSAFELISRSCLDMVFKHITDVHEPFAQRHEWYLLIKLGDAAQTHLVQALRDALGDFTAGDYDFLVTGDEAVAEKWWRLRKSISEAQKREGISIKHDVSIPVSGVAEFMIRTQAELDKVFPQARILAFGHLGDGNIHYNVSMPDAGENSTFIRQHEREVNRIVYRVVTELQGSISAEHGLGQLKRDEITRYKSETELALMRSIKHSFDPLGLMNPGKVI
ncbi:MAG: FAD-binding oxidoreductase [Pseudomonadota bacterium]